LNSRKVRVVRGESRSEQEADPAEGARKFQGEEKEGCRSRTISKNTATPRNKKLTGARRRTVARRKKRELLPGQAPQGGRPAETWQRNHREGRSIVELGDEGNHEKSPVHERFSGTDT